MSDTPQSDKPRSLYQRLHDAASSGDNVMSMNALLREAAAALSSATQPEAWDKPAEIRWWAGKVYGHPTVGDLLDDAERQLAADPDAAGQDDRIKRMIPRVRELLCAAVPESEARIRCSPEMACLKSSPECQIAGRCTSRSAIAQPVAEVYDNAVGYAGWKLLECAGGALHANRCKEIAEEVVAAYLASVNRQMSDIHPSGCKHEWSRRRDGRQCHKCGKVEFGQFAVSARAPAEEPRG